MHAMPPYCAEFKERCDLNTTQSKIVLESWQLCMSGDCEPYREAQSKQSKEPTLTPEVFFFNTFFNRLFDMLPEVKAMFKNFRSQSRMLAKTLNYLVMYPTEPDRQDEFDLGLVHVAAAHNKRGIKPYHYNIMGLVLLYTLRTCLGEHYNDNLNRAWVMSYSRMMHVVIPVVIQGTYPEDLNSICPMPKSSRGRPASCPVSTPRNCDTPNAKTKTKSDYKVLHDDSHSYSEKVPSINKHYSSGDRTSSCEDEDECCGSDDIRYIHIDKPEKSEKSEKSKKIERVPSASEEDRNLSLLLSKELHIVSPLHRPNNLLISNKDNKSSK